ncbi:MAG: cytochrome C [Rhodothermales bacterium]
MKKYALLFVISCLISTTASAQRPPARELPDGPGKMLVEANCTSCHQASTIMRSAGYDTPERWQEVMSSMVNLPDDQAQVISEYLVEHFPEKPERRPTLIPGDVEIDIKEWVVPTLGQRSRDPIEALDGSIWWTGMWASLAGRLDPETGQMQEYPLPPEARPHSIVPDEEGNIWYTGNSNGTIGKLDPETGDITEFKTEARDPHTAAFHPNGNLYFTAQRAGMLGRLDPKTGDLTEIKTEPRPYGIKVADDGTVWVAYNGTNKIGALDPKSMEVRYYPISDPETRIRRLGLSSDGYVWYVNSTMGRIGRLDPATGKIKEWASPSGPKSHPYALAVIDDKIWYNESGMRPDALVRFDPETEEFQSWAIPSGVGIIRHVWTTRDGNLLIHQSSSNRVGLVTIKDLVN